MKRRIDLPALYDPKPSVLRACRQIDPAAELIYIGEGEWWLGVVKPNAHRRRTAAAILAHEWRKDHPSFENLRLGHLMLQGFSFLNTFHSVGELTDGVAEWLAEADHWYRHATDAHIETEFVEGPRNRAVRSARAYFKDRTMSEGRARYRYQVQGQRTAFSYSGQRHAS